MSLKSDYKDAQLATDDKLLLDFGVVDSSGDITSEGFDLLKQLLLAEHKHKLITAVKDIQLSGVKKSSDEDDE